MYSGQTVSLETILWKISGGLYEQLNPEDAYMYAKEGIKLVGAPLSFENVVTVPPLKIVDHKATLPRDLVQIRGVRLITNTDNYNDNPIGMTHATDIYHPNINCEVEDIEYPIAHPGEYTYQAQAGVLTTSVSTGDVQVAYKKLLTCDNGYPLIPDNEKVLYAIEYQIRWRFLEPLWEMGKVTDKVFNYIITQRDFYIGAAQSSMQLASMDHVEATMNAINRLIIPDFSHANGFKRLGKKEEIKRFN